MQAQLQVQAAQYKQYFQQQVTQAQAPGTSFADMNNITEQYTTHMHALRQLVEVLGRMCGSIIQMQHQFQEWHKAVQVKMKNHVEESPDHPKTIQENILNEFTISLMSCHVTPELSHTHTHTHFTWRRQPSPPHP